MRLRLLVQVLGVILPAMAVIYGPILFPFDVSIILGRADLWNYLGAMSFFMDYTIHHGEWPQWNPLLFCGTPFAANPQAALYYPVHLVRSLLNTDPSPMSTFVSIALMQGFHLILLATGTFFLARAFRMGKLGALVAAVGYMSSATISFRLVQHWHFVAIAAWFPWQLLLFRRALMANRTREKAAYGLAAGLLFGIGILPGFPQLTIYAGVLLVSYWIVHRLVYGRPDGAGDSRARCLASDIGLMALLFGAAILVAMPSLLPAFELSTYSVRAKQMRDQLFGAYPIQLNPFTHPADLGMALLLFCGKQGVSMIGATAALLVLCCARHPRRRQVVACGILFLVALDCCITPSFPFGWIVASISPFHITEPQRATVFAALFWALLAGFGVEALVSPARSRFSPRFWFALLMLLGASILWALLEWVWLSPEYPIPAGAWLIPSLVLPIMVMSFYRPLRRFSGWMVLLVLIGEAALWNHAYIPQLIRQNSYPGTTADLNRTPSFQTSNHRWVGGIGDQWAGNTSMYALKPVINGYDPLTIERIRAVLGAPRRAGGYDRRLLDWEVTRENERATRLGKRRFRLFEDRDSSPASLSKIEDFPSFCPVREDTVPLVQPIVFQQEGKVPGVVLLPAIEGKGEENELCIWYRAGAAGTMQVDFRDLDRSDCFPGKTVTWSAPVGQFTAVRLPLPDFEHMQTVLRPCLVESGKQLEINQVHVARGGDSNARVAITGSRANSVTLRLDDLPKPATLCFMEARYAGWRAALDGKPVSIEPAFDVFQSIRVPAGTHTVSFEFDSFTVKIGALIGVVSVVLACALLAVLVWRSS